MILEIQKISSNVHLGEHLEEAINDDYHLIKQKRLNDKINKESD